MYQAQLVRILTAMLLLAALFGCDEKLVPPRDLDWDIDAAEQDQSEPDQDADAQQEADEEQSFIGCKSDDDCLAPDFPFCVVETGKCIQCQSREDCHFDAPYCDQGRCIPCVDDAQCRASAYGPKCNVDEGVCIECMSNDDCGGEIPVCDTMSGACGACIEPFDCQDVAKPSCSADPESGRLLCLRHDTCQGDDAFEANGDDGPLGATRLSPDGSAAVHDAALCADPEDEADWFVVAVEDGDSLRLSIDTAGLDVDISAYNASGALLGESWYQDPEQLELTFLPAGDVYFALSAYADEPFAAAKSYQLSVERIAGACASAADCAASYHTQLLRPECAPSGACQRIVGNGQLALGAPCDNAADCDSGACGYGRTALVSKGFGMMSWYWSMYLADANERAVCTLPCTEDGDCAQGQRCTTVFGSGNYCTLPCESAQHCPVDILDIPESGAWKHLRCESGNCIP
jgi:hypothetical protein